MSAACICRVRCRKVTTKSPQIELRDSRRFTGANLIMDVAGPVMDVQVDDAEKDALVASWGANATRMLKALGWGNETLYDRRYPGGVSLAFSAPIDVLYAACEVNEWALNGGDFEAAFVRLQGEVEKERNPRLLALRDAADAHDVAFLWDDDDTSVGLGVGSKTWRTTDLPDPEDVDWSAIHDIPVVMVTGTNGKSTTVRLMAAMVAADGKVPGLSTAVGAGSPGVAAPRGRAPPASRPGCRRATSRP